MTGCHDDASGLADRNQDGEGVAGWTTGRRSGGGRMAPPGPRASERPTAVPKETLRVCYLDETGMSHVNKRHIQVDRAL
jgi:hypothetical protein